MIRQGQRRQRGFALVEILVALAVLGLVVLGLGQGLRFGLQAWSRAAEISDAGEEMEAVDRILRHLIARMDPGTQTRPAPFAAGPGRLAFVSSLPAPPGQPERRVEAMLSLDEGRRGLLVLRWRPYLHARPLRPQPFAEAGLLRGVSGIEFAFWNQAGGGGWSAGWSGIGLPPLVRVRLAFAPPGRRHWPDIVAAPGLDRP